MPKRSMTSLLAITAMIGGGAFTVTQTPANGIDISTAHKADIVAYVGEVPNIAGSPIGSWTLTLEHSDTINAGFAAVADTDVALEDGGSIANGVYATIDDAAKDDAYFRIGYIGAKKYVRVVATAVGAPDATAIIVFVETEPSIIV